MTSVTTVGAKQSFSRVARVRRRVTSDTDSGFTLIEVLIAMAISALVLALVAPLASVVTGTTTRSQAVTDSASSAALGLESVGLAVGSASEICLPTTLQPGSSAPIAASGFAVRVLTTAFSSSDTGTWEQWWLNTATNELERQSWSPAWASTDAVPPWVVVASGVVNSPSDPPFSLSSAGSGSIDVLGVSLVVSSGEASTAETTTIDSSFAALDTAYASGPGSCASTDV